MTTASHFTTVEKLKERLAHIAADNHLEFESVDETILFDRLEAAYNIIEGTLLTRNISTIQISTWKRGEEFQLDIATYWYGKGSGWAGKSIEEKDWLKVFNREAELSNVPIVSNDGVIIVKGKGPVAAGQNLLDTNAALGIYP